MLYQIMDDGEIMYISFMARSLQASERKYSTTQKEMLAIVFALKKFQYYVWGQHFTLFCDHHALSFLHTQKDLSPMITGWLDTILDYTFKIVYCPGVLNVLPDASHVYSQKIFGLQSQKMLQPRCIAVFLIKTRKVISFR